MRVLFLLAFLLLVVSTILAQWSTNPAENSRVTDGGLLPQIITDGTGGAYIVYQDSPALLRQLWVQRLDRYGFVRFPENGIRVSSPERNQTPDYFLVSDSVGGVIVAFRDFQENGEETRSAVYVQRLDSLGRKLWGDAGIEVQDDEVVVSACCDGNQGVFVFWSEGPTATGFQLRAQRINAGGELLWPQEGVTITAEFTSFNIPMPATAVSDGFGNAIILYSDSSGTKLQKVSGQGELLWGEGVSIFPVGRQMIGDGKGGVIVAGAQRVFGNQETIAVQRVHNNGEVLWDEEGVVVTELGDTFTSTVDLLVNQGNTVITWQDGRTGQSRVYMQSINEFGEVRWQKDGLSVGSVDTVQGRPRLIESTDQQFMVIWRDSRIEDRGIFLQKFNLTGSALWSEDVFLSTRMDFQRDHEVTTDGSGGAIVCWYEICTGSGWGIFAQQVSRNGKLGEVLVTSVSQPNKAPIPIRYVLHQSYPNPFNAEMVIKYEIPESNRVTLAIYDMTGKEVITLINKKQTPGAYRVNWNGKNQKGGDVASGLYFYQLRAGSCVDIKKALFIK